MSTIEKLRVHGVRSFGAEENDKADIIFSTPLTLILGQNGCGKTTIIEALKYVTCGELPAGTDMGRGFVHDPQLANTNLVQGEVKLQFRDVRGRERTVQKVFQVTKKIRNMEFKSLANSIADGKKVLDSKCANIEAIVSSTMGVSKAILTNVIFCHQEDSTWPLEKGKKIKEKFDAIFGIVEYNKCLDHLRGMAKDKATDVKVKQAEVAAKLATWEEAQEKSKKLESTNTQLAANQDEKDRLKKTIDPIQRKIDDIMRKQTDHINYLSEVKEKNFRKRNIEDNIKELRATIKHLFAEDKAKLKSMLQDFDRDLGEKKQKLRNSNEEKDTLSREEQWLQKEISTKQTLFGKLQSEDQQNENQIENRNLNLKNLADELKLPLMSNSQINETNGDELLKSIEREIKAQNAELDNLERKQEEMEKNLSNDMESIKEKKIKLETSIQRAKTDINVTEKELQTVNKEIAEVDRSSETLKNLEVNLSQLRSELNEKSALLDVDLCKTNIQENNSSIGNLEKTLSSLEKEIESLQKSSIEKAKLDGLRKNKESQEKEYASLLEKNANSLKHLLNEVPDADFARKLDDCGKKLTSKIKTLETNIQKQERELALLQQQKKSKEEQLRQKRKKSDEDADKIEECCGSNDINAYLTETMRKMDESQETKGTLTSSQVLFDRYIKKLKSDDPVCPLCRREFSDCSDVDELVKELEKRIREIPSKLDETQSELKMLQQRHSKALQLKPLFEQLNFTRNDEIPRLKKEITDVGTKIESIEAELESNKQQLQTPQTDEVMAKKLVSDAALMDQCQRDITRLNTEIRRVEERCPNLNTTRGLDEANAEQLNLRSKIANLRKKVDAEQEKLSAHNETINDLKDKINKLSTQQLKIAGSAQNRKKLTEEVARLEGKLKSLKEQMAHDKAQLEPLCSDLVERDRQLRQTKVRNKTLLKEKRNSIIDYEKKVETIKNIQREITDYANKNGKQRLGQTRNELTDLNMKQSEMVARKKKLEAAIVDLDRFIITQELERQDMENNLKLLDKQEDLRAMQREIETLEGGSSVANVDEMNREYKKLNEEKKKVEEDISFIMGKITELQRSSRELRIELDKPLYKDAEKEYRKYLIKLTVLKKTIEDIKEYVNGMDYVMMNFHKDRMKTINDFVRNLWRQIYRGGDIDHIEIKAEDSVTSSTGRKNYSYKVVQSKGGIEMEMPGRCSAGQKVLACLIIRMALAETFSKNCGILALDEPTTNLDKDNIESLSEALAEIIETRSTHRNFQLIVITHDESFKRLLRGAVNSYIEVKRDDRGKSKVVCKEA